MTPDVLDTATPVVLDERAPEFDGLLDAWADRGTAHSTRQAVHRFELERAAVPPVINVTVAGVPGRFSNVVGTGDVSYVAGEIQ
jgi:hypothetical protein